MTDISTLTLLIILAGLIVLSGFFSCSETGMMAINRYRLRHLTRINHRGARNVSNLLERPDRLISLILIGNNFVNLLASAIATIVAVRLWGDIGIAISTLLLTFIILVFAEITPKTIAAVYPEKIAFPASYILGPMLKITSPMVSAINSIVNIFLRLLRVDPVRTHRKDDLNRDELKTLLRETSRRIPEHYQKMMLSILDLEHATVEDIIVPKNEIVGIDLDDDLELILNQLTHSQHTRLPVYRHNIENIIGVIHVRHLLNQLTQTEITLDDLQNQMRDAYFVPEGTPLITQLHKFQANKRRLGFVVDEYGDLLGLVTLDDILEEIVGDFTTDATDIIKLHKTRTDGSVQVIGSMTIRDLNKVMSTDFSTEGPKTVNGLIMETLESIPQDHMSLMINGHPIEIVRVKHNAVKTAVVYPKREEPSQE